MYLTEILEVAIGLVFMWMVVSLAAMQLQEWVANLLKWRSNDLENSIRRTLADPDLTRQFYEHQIIRGLIKDPNWWNKLWMWFGNLFRKLFKKPLMIDLRPSYIPSTDFALTVFDLVMQAGSEASPIKKAFDDIDKVLNDVSQDEMNEDKKQAAKKILAQLLEEAKRIASTNIGQDAISTVKFEINRFADDHPALRDDINKTLLPGIDAYYNRLLDEQRQYPVDEFDKDLNLKRLRIGLMAIEETNPKLHELLRSLLSGVEEYVDDKEKALAIARKNVEDWFDQSMSRLSGWYKRKAQLTAFIIGFLLALVMNVDSINVAVNLWREPTLRQAIVAQAQAYAQANPDALKAGQDGAASSSGSAGGQQGGTPSTIVTNLQRDLANLNIPFGWETKLIPNGGSTCAIIPIGANKFFGFAAEDPKQCKIPIFPVDTTGWLAKIVGILVTGAASAQGAPFWFDILKKFINVRSSGTNPAEEALKG